MQHHTNEVVRIVADFSNFLRNATGSSDIYPIGPETRLFIVGDQLPDGQITYSLIGGADWTYRLVDTLCDQRVVDAEFGRLLANGQRLSAEKYLGLWRAAIAAPMPVDKLIAAGFTPFNHMALPTAECLKKRERHPGDVADWFASPHLVSTDAALSVWEVPLDTYENLMLSAQLRDVYWSSEHARPEYHKETRLRVDNPVVRHAAKPPALEQHELIGEAA